MQEHYLLNLMVIGYIYIFTQDLRRQDAPERWGHGEHPCGGTPARSVVVSS
jgi:hypothetical protein